MTANKKKMPNHIKICLSFILTITFIASCSSTINNNAKRNLQRKCLVNKALYKEGDKFQHSFDDCLYNCTCAFKDNGDAYGNCSMRCPPFRYPPGCTPTKNQCNCYDSYTCPEAGDKCEDSVTGRTYQVGEKWTNGSCTCTCIGNQKGIYQCQCIKTHKPPVTSSILQKPCTLNETAQCYSCDTLNTSTSNCIVRQRCEQWLYLHKLKEKYLVMLCTCYGPHGYTRCVAKVKSHRTRRSALHFVLSSEVTIQSDSKELHFERDLVSEKIYSLKVT